MNDLETGGAQTLIDGLIGQFKENHDVSLVVLQDPGALSERLGAQGIPITYLNMTKLSDLWRAIPRLHREIRTFKPDLVHSHLLQSDILAIASIKGTPVVSTIHTTSLTNRSIAGFVTAFVASVLSRVQRDRRGAAVACTPAAQRYMRRWLYRDSRDTQIIHNGVRPVTASPPERIGRVVMLARWHPMKDHANAFAAWAQVCRSYPGAILICAGHGMDESNHVATQLASEHGISRQVQFLGTTNSVSHLLASSEALLISSAYGEALPMAGIESLAAGRPVVTTDVGDCSTLAVAEWLVSPPRDPAKLAKSVVSLLRASDDEYSALCADAQERAADNFSMEKCAADYLALYSRVSSNETPLARERNG